MYLLDTNICIALLNGNQRVVQIFNTYFPQCYTSTIVIAELYKGIYNSQRVQENLDNLAELVTLLDVKPFDTVAANEFGKIQAELRTIGRPTGELDALIAAVARSNADTVVTQNIRDFENISHLKLENWLD
jgi:tRNA(fMet)-specific endonuclease VapC